MGERLRSLTKAMAIGSALALASPALAEDVYPRDVAKQATKLQPISAWNLDYGEDSCRLTRIFGSEETTHILAIEQFSPSRGFRIIVAGPELMDWNKNRSFEIGLRSATPFTKVESFSSSKHSAFGTMLVLQSRLETDDLAEDELRELGIDLDLADDVERVVLRSRRGALSFETGGMQPVFEALNACTKDLLAAWGIEPATHASFTPVKYDWYEIQDEIWGALSSKTHRSSFGQSFNWRIIVEADGNASACGSYGKVTNEEVLEVGCAEIKKYRFVPARNASGIPMRSFTTVGVVTSRRMAR